MSEELLTEDGFNNLVYIKQPDFIFKFEDDTVNDDRVFVWINDDNNIVLAYKEQDIEDSACGIRVAYGYMDGKELYCKHGGHPFREDFNNVFIKHYEDYAVKSILLNGEIVE